MSDEFARLLSPIDVGPFELRNRIFCTGHTTAYNADGLISDQEVAYHVRKAQGGIALCITGSTTVHPTGGAPQMNLLASFDDSVLPGYRKLADGMHAHGARMLIQVTHLASGFASHHTGHPTWAPSQMMGEFARELPHTMTVEEIETILDAFYRAAVRVRGGLDGVELQAFAASLPSSSCRPTRTSGPISTAGPRESPALPAGDDRVCREALGPDRALAMKLAGDELVEGGLHLPEMQEIVRAHRRDRMIDFYIVASGNNMERSRAWTTGRRPQRRRGCTRAWRRASGGDPTGGGLARIVDPTWPSGSSPKARATWWRWSARTSPTRTCRASWPRARPQDVRPCVGDSTGCIDRILEGEPMRCIYNPIIGRERAWARWTGAAPRRVWSSAAGREAWKRPGRAERGHQVVLFERSAELGGAAGHRAAAGPRGDDRHPALAGRAGARARRGRAAQYRGDRRDRPRGAARRRRRRHRGRRSSPAALGRVPFVSALAVLSGAVEPGRNVLVVDHTGKQVGCAVAELVADRGGHAEVVSRQFHPAIDFGLTNTVSLYRRCSARAWS